MNLKESGTLRDRDGELLENWYVACLSTELSKKPIQRIIYDTPLVLFRDEQGKAHCFRDRCLHRGALLSEGKVVGNQIQCPYHGWRYAIDGSVQHIPSEGPATKPKGKYCQSVFPSFEQDDCVWIWMGEAAPAEKTPPFRFPFLKDSAWQSYFMITDFDNEVTHLAENFMDVPHTATVHAGWFRTHSSRKVPICVKSTKEEVLVTYDCADDAIGFSGLLFNANKYPLQHTDRFIMPNLTRVDYSFGDQYSFIIVSQITPISSLKSRVYTAIIYKFPVWMKALKGVMRLYTRKVIQQDVEIMRIQGRSFQLQGEGSFTSTSADIVHLSIERLREKGRKGDPLPIMESRKECEIWV